MDTQRLVLFFIFSFSLLLLWDAWEKDHRPKPVPAPAAKSVPAAPGVPAAPAEPKSPAAVAAPSVPTAAASAAQGERIVVRTDLYVAEIDTVGGTLRRLELLKHRDSLDEKKNLVLLGPEHGYEAQSGLAGDLGANHRTLWQAEAGPRELAQGQAALQLKLSAQGRDGIAVSKVYTFHRDSYLIDVSFEVRNGSAAPVSP